MRKRNPMARDLRVNPLYRPRKGKSLRDQEGRADRWSCAAKLKQPKGTPGSAHGPGDFVRAAGPSAQRAHRGVGEVDGGTTGATCAG